MADETKLTIHAFDDEKFSQNELTFSVMFNPSNYTRKIAITYDDKAGPGSTGLPQKFTEIKPGDFQLEFVIDGTGTVASINVSNATAASIAKDEVKQVDVAAKIKEFRDVCVMMRSKTHRPPFLRIVWGKTTVDCVLMSCDIKHTLFDKKGNPIRATISATFKEAISDEMRVAKDKKSSPDLTHKRIVQEGDTLPLMTYRIYGDSKYYLQVAKANGLKDFRKLKAGQEIYFPPINKSSSKA